MVKSGNSGNRKLFNIVFLNKNFFKIMRYSLYKIQILAYYDEIFCLANSCSFMARAAAANWLFDLARSDWLREASTDREPIRLP